MCSSSSSSEAKTSLYTQRRWKETKLAATLFYTCFYYSTIQHSTVFTINKKITKSMKKMSNDPHIHLTVSPHTHTHTNKQGFLFFILLFSLLGNLSTANVYKERKTFFTYSIWQVFLDVRVAYLSCMCLSLFIFFLFLYDRFSFVLPACVCERLWTSDSFSVVVFFFQEQFQQFQYLV